jgi:ectoine hydroxylase-related dioxygenase (phytanoyl-CoA dioxygenase family)
MAPATAAAYPGGMDRVVIGDAAAAAFARDGVACVRGVLTPGELATAAAAIETVLAQPGPAALVASSPDDPGSFSEDFCRWREIGEIEALARHSAVPRIAAALMSTPQVRFYHDHILVKEGGTRQRTPWHQDQPYYNVDGRGVSAWIPVDPVPEAGCLELVAGSHRGPWLMPRTFLEGQARWFPEGSLAELPDIEADRDAFDIRRFELQPGDAIFFDFLSVHGAPGFPFPGRRRVLSLRYLSAGARHAPRGWRTSPPFGGLDAELPSGAVMDHPLFPVVWPPASGAGSASGSRIG